MACENNVDENERARYIRQQKTLYKTISWFIMLYIIITLKKAVLIVSRTSGACFSRKVSRFMFFGHTSHVLFWVYQKVTTFSPSKSEAYNGNIWWGILYIAQVQQNMQHSK